LKKLLKAKEIYLTEREGKGKGRIEWAS